MLKKWFYLYAKEESVDCFVIFMATARSNLFNIIFNITCTPKRMNSFFYGNPHEGEPLLPKMIPIQSSQLNKGIDFKSSTFKISASKASTFR